MSTRPMITVIIPTRNAGHGLRTLLETLQRQQLPGDLEIVVIDSGSRDRTTSIAAELGAKVHSVASRHFNHGRTRNQAIRASRGDFILLTVQDALPTDDLWAARLLAPLTQNTEVAGSFGLQIAPPQAGALSRARSLLWQEANSQPAVRSIANQRDFEALSPEQRLGLIRFDNVTACVRRTAWEALPFREISYGEDMAWARDALLEGLKIAYVPEAQVWHHHERTWTYDLRRAYLYGYIRVGLIDWPLHARLRLREALVLLYRAASTALATKLESIDTSAAVEGFLAEEMAHCQEWTTRRQRVHREAIGFSRQIWYTVSRMYHESVLPEGIWEEIYRYAVTCVVGESLGETAAIQLRQTSAGERAVWQLLNRALGTGV